MYRLISLTIVTGLCWLFTPFGLAAGPIADPYNEQRFFDFKAMPAERLLGPKLFQRYMVLLADQDCEAASLILNREFVARYPGFRDAATKSGGYSRPYTLWRLVLVPKRYPELSMCIHGKELKNIEDRIRREDPIIGLYQHGSGDSGPLEHEPGTSWFMRDYEIHSIAILAQENYPPAYIKLAELTRRGGVFSFGDDVEYYLIRRACHLGLDCAAHRQRIKALQAKLDKSTVAAMDKLARRKKHMLFEIFPDD